MPGLAQTLAPPAPVAPSRIAASSPGIGTFAPRGQDDGLSPTRPGDPVQEREVLGYLCQGPARWILSAPEAGRLGDIPAPGTLFGYGDTILTLEPDA